MARLTKSEVLHIAKLSKLNLEEKEIDIFLPQLSSIVDYVSELSGVDTKNTEPTSQTTGLENVFRKDEVSSKEALNENEATGGTDSSHNGYFKVPAILEGRSDK